MRKRKELVSDISKGENSSTISADNYLRPTELSPRRSNESNWSESIYPPGGTRNPIRKTQTVFRCVPIFQIRGKQICGAVCFPFPGADMPLNQCEVNVLGCIRIHQASGEWRVEMTVFRFVVCGHTHIHTHREIQSAGWEYTRSLGEVKGGVNRFGIAGTQRSRKKTYSIPITRLIRPNPPVFRRGRQSRFPFYRSPPPPECTTAGEYTRFAPPEWQPLFRYSPLDLQFRPSIHEIPAFPRNPALFLAIRLAIHRLAPFPRPFRVFASSCTPPGVRVHGFPFPPFLRGFEAFWKPTADSNPTVRHSYYPSALFQSSIAPHPLYRSFLYTRTAPPMESNVSPVFASTTWPRSIFLHPSNLSPFSRLVASLRPGLFG